MKKVFFILLLILSLVFTSCEFLSISSKSSNNKNDITSKNSFENGEIILELSFNQKKGFNQNQIEYVLLIENTYNEIRSINREDITLLTVQSNVISNMEKFYENIFEDKNKINLLPKQKLQKKGKLEMSESFFDILEDFSSSRNIEFILLYNQNVNYITKQILNLQEDTFSDFKVDDKSPIYLNDINFNNLGNKKQLVYFVEDKYKHEYFDEMYINFLFDIVGGEVSDCFEYASIIEENKDYDLNEVFSLNKKKGEIIVICDLEFEEDFEEGLVQVDIELNYKYKSSKRFSVEVLKSEKLFSN